jgi:hypothetical protein
MKVNDALSILKNHKGSHCCSCYIPSLKREVGFRPITVSELKSLAKMSVDDSEFAVALNAVIQLLCLEELDFTKLTEIDKAHILINIKRANHLGDDAYKINCGFCQAGFVYQLDIDTLLGQLQDAPEPKEIEKQDGSNKFKFIINVPSIDVASKNTKFLNILTESMTKENYTQEEQEAVRVYMLKCSTLLFIREIYINDEQIEDMDEMTFEQRTELLDLLPASILNDLMKIIIEEPKYNLMQHLTVDIICPQCQKKFPLLVNLIDFFRI